MFQSPKRPTPNESHGDKGCQLNYTNFPGDPKTTQQIFVELFLDVPSSIVLMQVWFINLWIEEYKNIYIYIYKFLHLYIPSLQRIAKTPENRPLLHPQKEMDHLSNQQFSGVNSLLVSERVYLFVGLWGIPISQWFFHHVKWSPRWWEDN